MGSHPSCSSSLSPPTSMFSSWGSKSRRKRRPKLRLALPPPPPLMILLLSLLLFIQPSLSVLITSFENCLDKNVRESPTRVQFHPVLVAVDFGETDNELRVTVWGNVTGASSANPGLESANRRRNTDIEGHYRPEASAWLRKRQADSADENVTEVVLPTTAFSYEQFPLGDTTWDSNINYQTTGAIVHKDPSWTGPHGTTLEYTVMVATFQAARGFLFFCNNQTSVNAGGKCPMGAVKLTNDTKAGRHDLKILTKELDYFTLQKKFDSGYTFTSLDTTLRILSGEGGSGTVMGCVRIEITPYLGTGNGLALKWVPAGVLAFVTIGTILAAIFNPWDGTTDVFRWSSNYGMDEDIIRLVTPGFADCLQWLQFFVLTGSLSLNYPGFYQPAVSKVAWSILLFNTSFYSHDPISKQTFMQNGVYALDASAVGFERLAQAVGLQTINDIWTCAAAWFAVALVGTVVCVQSWIWGRWAVRRLAGVEEEDLTKKNWPFTGGMMNRMTFTYFLTPILAVSGYQLTAAGRSETTITALAAVLITLVLAIAIYLSYKIWNHNPRSSLFDDLPTLLFYGTFYNTYREKNLKFFLVQLYVNIIRALTFGVLQISGIAQITILAVCEIVLILTIYAIKPYAPATSMNAWQAIFAVIRLLTVVLMMGFVPNMNAVDSAKAWIGYVILVIHGLVLIFGFFFKAVQTMLELFIRGCGGTDEEAARGGLAKVFGKRQLSRRARPKHSHHSAEPSMAMPSGVGGGDRMSSVAGSRPGGIRPISQSESSAVLLGGANGGDMHLPLGEGGGSQHGHGHSGSGSTGFTPTTPGAASAYSYLGTGGHGPGGSDGLVLNTAAAAAVAGPYYRQPRASRFPKGEGSAGSDTYSPGGGRSRGSWGSEVWGPGGTKQRSSQGSLPAAAAAAAGEEEWNDNRGNTNYTGTRSAGGPSGEASGHRHTESSITAGSGRAQTDYAVREVDFYYGVRGPALSAQPGRRLGTGPADPTGPVSTAKGWLWKKLGMAGGEKEKGFTVVRSSRAPEALKDAEREAKGIGVAVTSDGEERPRGEGESDSDDSESDGEEIGAAVQNEGKQREPLESDTDSSDDGGDVVPEAVGLTARMSEKLPMQSGIELQHTASKASSRNSAPKVPRKSSKRKSATLLQQDPNPQPHEPMALISPPESPTQVPGQAHLYDPPIPRHVVSGGSSSRLPFTAESRGFPRSFRGGHDRDIAHSRSVSTTSSFLAPPPGIVADTEDGACRPASVGNVQSYRMEDSLRVVGGNADMMGSRAELVEGSRNGSMGSHVSRGNSNPNSRGNDTALQGRSRRSSRGERES